MISGASARKTQRLMTAVLMEVSSLTDTSDAGHQLET